MCGIVGAIGGRSQDRQELLDRALDALAHRGPDGRGAFVSQDVTLGHTRLAIIDPSARSDQPMVDHDSGCVLAFNGEIYNYLELRHELESHGHHFVSSGDTEVLLHSYLRWGHTCVDHFNGMFAFAIWDPRDTTLLLARDRLGEKPLHLMELDGTLWFASEIKALVAVRRVAPAVDQDHLFAFLAYGDLGHPTRTPYVGIEQVPAGHTVRIQCRGLTHSAAPVRYWALPEPCGDGDSRLFPELFADSVRLRLRSDVPLGTSLSGGLDSSLVLATVRAHQPTGDLHAFTASFPGTIMDELPRAAAVADGLDVTLHAVPLGPNDLVVGLEAVIAANEGPVESPSTVAQYFVMRAAREAGITVLLDGQGADETWAGYDKYTALAVLDDWVSGHPIRGIRREIDWRRVRGRLLRPAVGRFVSMAAGTHARRLAAPFALRAACAWLDQDYVRAHSGFDVLDGTSAIVPGRIATEAARLDLGRITLPRLLRYADRNSMAWSREVRLPFLDHRLVELAATCSLDGKIVHGWPKEPIRRSLSSYGLNEVARRRDKKAYMPPLLDWLGDATIRGRVRDAWSELHRAGVVRREEASSPIARWRVLAAATWMMAPRAATGMTGRQP